MINLTREEAQQVLNDLEGEIPFYSENDCNTPEWITNAIELLRARLSAPEPEREQCDMPCIEDDGCPTEKAVLQRFWRKHRQLEPEPMAWLITDEMINSLQVDSIQRLIDRARHAHMTDIKLRINGQDEWHQADWIKHMKRAASPQREWVGLTNEECTFLACKSSNGPHCVAMTEAKLKEKNAPYL